MPEFDPRRDEDCAELAAALVGFALGVRTESILAPGRGRPAATRARHITMYVLTVGAGMSLSRVAGALRRDRSTVSYACRLIEADREDEEFDVWIEQICEGLASVILLQPAEPLQPFESLRA